MNRAASRALERVLRSILFSVAAATVVAVSVGFPGSLRPVRFKRRGRLESAIQLELLESSPIDLEALDARFRQFIDRAGD
jgi:hypothetical protein